MLMHFLCSSRMATGKSDGENDSKLSSCLRKRRTASLVAEALWNIQMEEDTSINGKHVKGKKRDIHPSRSFLEDQSSVGRPDWKSVNVKPNVNRQRQCNSAALLGNTADCLHLTTCSRKLPNTSSGGRKPVASVLPLVKSEGRQTSLPKERYKHTSTSSASSQVLLLPISLNSGVDAAVPVLALRPSSMGLDFMNCLNASTLVNVTLTSANADLVPTKADCQMHSLSELKNLDGQGTCEYEPGVTEEAEPLNVKSRDSAVQSCPKWQSLKEKPKCKHQIEESARREEEFQSSIILSSCIRNSSGMQINGTSMAVARKNAQWPRSKESNSFVACSPSSESSSSTDLDDSAALIKSVERRRRNISLRPKAAPPPAETALPNIAHLNRSRYYANNGWTWEGKPYTALVFSMESGGPVVRRCYPSMRRRVEPSSRMILCEDGDSDDIIMVRDCVVLRADGGEQPYVAKVAALWQQPSTGKMMISLLWFYRPEHIGDTRVLDNHHSDDELFASKHLDEISVECVEDKCYVLTYNQYCRYMAESVRMQEHIGAVNGRNLVPTVPRPYCQKTCLLMPSETDRLLVFFCRKLYDIKSHRLLKTFPLPTTLFYASQRENSL